MGDTERVPNTPGLPDRNHATAAAVPTVRHDLIAIGASAGGVETLQRLVAELPAELPASVLIAVHMLPSGPSYLHGILDRAGPLPASRARDGEKLERGRIYVAPPGVNMVLEGDSIRLRAGSEGPGHHHPAIDQLFLSVAESRGERAIGVVLTGTLDDGSRGLRQIKERGGIAVVQDPDDAEFGDMPRNAIDRVEPDRIVPLAELAEVLGQLTEEMPRRLPPPSPAASNLGPPPEDVLLLTCPTCGGVLIERAGDAGVRFVCQAGHAYTPESLLEQQAAALEATLAQTMRAVGERAELLGRISKRSARHAEPDRRAKLEARAASAARHADEIRETILRLRGIVAKTRREADR